MKGKCKYFFGISMLYVMLVLAIAIQVKGFKTINPLKISTSDTVNDPANDVIFVNNSAMTWDYATIHLELDIDTLTRLGQNFTITYHDNITIDIDYTYALAIYKTWGDVDYAVTFMSENGYLYNGSNYHWNGTDWSLGVGDAYSIGVISGNTVEISIPTQALLVDNSWNWYFQGIYQDIGFSYVDGCPNEIVKILLEDYKGPSRIIGYELSIIIGIIIISTLGLIYRIKKGNK